jgi:hypothetical protein
MSLRRGNEVSWANLRIPSGPGKEQSHAGNRHPGQLGNGNVLKAVGVDEAVAIYWSQ